MASSSFVATTRMRVGLSAVATSHDSGRPAAPAIAAWLVDVTGSTLAPSYYLNATSLISLAAVAGIGRMHSR